MGNIGGNHKSDGQHIPSRRNACKIRKLLEKSKHLCSYDIMMYNMERKIKGSGYSICLYVSIVHDLDRLINVIILEIGPRKENQFWI